MNKKVLVVDDSIAIRKIVQSTFDGLFDVLTAENGEQGWEIIEETPPNLVLIDVNMPGMNGYELCRKLKTDMRFQFIPAILMIGTFDTFDEDLGKTANFDHIISKPFESEFLIKTVDDAITKAEENMTDKSVTESRIEFIEGHDTYNDTSGEEQDSPPDTKQNAAEFPDEIIFNSPDPDETVEDHFDDESTSTDNGDDFDTESEHFSADESSEVKEFEPAKPGELISDAEEECEDTFIPENVDTSADNDNKSEAFSPAMAGNTEKNRREEEYQSGDSVDDVTRLLAEAEAEALKSSHEGRTFFEETSGKDNGFVDPTSDRRGVHEINEFKQKETNVEIPQSISNSSETSDAPFDYESFDYDSLIQSLMDRFGEEIVERLFTKIRQELVPEIIREIAQRLYSKGVAD